MNLPPPVVSLRRGSGAQTCDPLSESFVALTQACSDPQQVLALAASMVRESLQAWCVVVYMPMRSACEAMSAAEPAAQLDLTVVRDKFPRNGKLPSTTTLRFVDGQPARALQACAGNDEDAVVLCVVHPPNGFLDMARQAEQMQAITGAAETIAVAVRCLSPRTAQHAHDSAVTPALEQVTPSSSTLAEPQASTSQERAVAAPVPHEAIALGQSTSRPPSPVGSRSKVTLIRVLLIGLLGIAALVATSFVQIDHKLTATGSVEPSAVHNLVAPYDAVVTRFNVQDGAMVKAGDVLLELDSAELQQRWQVVQSDIQAAVDKLTLLDSLLVSVNRSGNESVQQVEQQLERQTLTSNLAGLRAQLTLLEAERERCLVRSPIDGQVVAWLVQQQLGQRPLRRGQHLLSVVDHTGPLRLILELPNRSRSDLLALATVESEIHVDFVLATAPQQTFQAVVKEIATAPRVNEQNQTVQDLIAETTELENQAMHLGAEVTAAIRCGRRSLLTSWFGGVTDFYDRHVRLYLP